MPKQQTDQTIQLPDGRTLGYAEYGERAGFPIFYFTGGNSSRFEGQWFAEAASRKQIRLIVPDRPGFGLSTFAPNRSLLDWAQDVLALAQALSLETFSIFGLSGGGPHVLAAAYKIPEKIQRTAVVSGTAPATMPNQYQGMWPPVRLIFATAKHVPFMNRFLLKQMAGFYSNQEQMLKRMKQAMPKPDVELIDNRPEIIEIFSKAAQEAHRQGVQGDAWEWQLYVRSWGFDLADIKMPIKLWYGLYDQQVPIGMGRFLANELPHAELLEVEDGGHFSTINNYIDDIFDYLCP